MSEFAPTTAVLAPLRRARLAALLGANLLAVPGVALAQAGGTGAVPTISAPVVQSVPGSTGMKLNEVLHRLSRNPTDVPTLIEAGRMSMQIGDSAAAVGFYQRAAKLAPGNPNVKAGLAGAYAVNDDPIAAINLFNEAEQAGPIDPALLAPRGLAYDLVGDNATAQKYYKLALAAASDDETVRRLALSQAISGDRRAMELTLTPLLQKQDKGAWRTRAFALAILGQGAEAESIVRSTMPAQLAEPMTAYLRYMPRLTAAQQAAAANLGQFPRAADIGREDPRFAAFQRPRAVLAAAAPVATPATRATAKDQARDRAKDRKRSRDAEPARTPVTRVAAAAAPTAPVAPIATRETTATPPVTTTPAVPRLAAASAAPRQAELPPLQAAAPSPAPRPASTPPLAAISTPAQVKPPVTAPAPATLAAAEPARVAPAPGAPASSATAPGFASLDGGGDAARGFTLKPATTVPAAAPAPAPAPAPVAPVRAAPPPAVAAAPVLTAAPAPAPAALPAAKPRNLAELFADLGPPSRAAEPAAGAVDVRRIAPAIDPKVKAAADAKAKAEREAKAAKEAEAREKAIKASAAAKHPSRVWVQVATGRNKAALAFDWRRFSKESPEVFAKRSPFVTAWGQTNRLLTGPFPSDKAASAYIAQLKKAGIDGAFSWTSPAGQIVDTLKAGK